MDATFPVAVASARHANSDTHEFWLTMDGERVSRSIWRAVPPGETIHAHAAMALKQLLTGYVYPPGDTEPPT